MEREGKVCGGEHDGETIVCEEFGYAPDTTKIWWLPLTKERFTYEDGEFFPFDGYVVHGTGYSF